METHNQSASPSIGKSEKAAQRKTQLNWDLKDETKVDRDRGKKLPWVVPLLHTSMNVHAPTLSYLHV